MGCPSRRVVTGHVRNRGIRSVWSVRNRLHLLTTTNEVGPRNSGMEGEVECLLTDLPGKPILPPLL